jgi:hypothetical protein
MSVARSYKPLPDELTTTAAWKQRMRDEPAWQVLADAYEYNLWHLNANGVSTYTNHPLNSSSAEDYLHATSDTYNEALVEVMRRRGFDPYARLADDLAASDASPNLRNLADVIRGHASDGARRISQAVIS